MNNAVWDIHNGIILKLVEGKQITHAIHGLDVLSEQSIKDKYGSPPVFNSIRYPVTNRLIDNKEGAYWIL